MQNKDEVIQLLLEYRYMLSVKAKGQKGLIDLKRATEQVKKRYDLNLKKIERIDKAVKEL